MRLRAAALLALLIAPALGSLGARRYWREEAPPTARGARNPYAGDPEALAAGAKLFGRYCATCHGKNAEGRGRAPALRSANVKNATPGELQWLLTNGILTRGMPPWAYLPDQQRWQIVAYLKTLPRD